ncbi:MAG TPA: contractile injection system tape measure protein, partial [Ferruginibacter sp.]|nr:contractile injection system tape measure protein [Ferruginibacter sp.]
ILHVFYDALETENKQELFQPLQSMIYELFSEDTEVVPVKRSVLRQPMEQVVTADFLYDRVQMLKYFFQFGTLPSNWEKIDGAQITDIMLQVAKWTPKIAKDLLLNAKEGAVDAAELFEIFGAARSKEIIKLVFREQERGLTDIVATFALLQDLYPYLATPASSFSKEIWRFVLDAMVFGPSPGISNETLAGVLLQKISTHYDVAPRKVVVSLEESIQRSFQQRTGYAPAIMLLKEVVATELDRTQEQVTADKKIVAAEEEQRPAYRSGRLQDVLRYVLMYGNMPWWAKKYFGVGVADMIGELYQADKAAMLLLFKKAMTQAAMKERLLTNMPFATNRELMLELPGGAETVTAIGDLMSAIEASKLFQYHDERFLQKTIVAVA